MGGFFGVASKSDCVFDLFFGTDYHSHLGTKRGGMVVYGKDGFERAIHNIENAPFRTKFEHDVDEMKGNLGIGCISDTEPQPLIVRSHLGNFAISTVGRINNIDALVKEAFTNGTTHFLEMSGGDINPTELTAALINQARLDPRGHPLRAGASSTARCRCSCSRRRASTPPATGWAARQSSSAAKRAPTARRLSRFAYLNLGYEDCRELGPGEVVFLTPESVETVLPPAEKMKICTFLWVYFGYPSSTYEKMNVEKMRYNCGDMLARRDSVEAGQRGRCPRLRHGACHRLRQRARASPSRARSSSTRPPGRARLCPPTRAKRNLIAQDEADPRG